MSEAQPLISLVLPVRNAMPVLRGAIDAIRRQTYRNFELLVQDGASTDDTVDYLRSVTDLPRVEIVSEADSGIGQAYNRGMARATGELICLVAADERLDDNALETMVQWHARHPDAVVVYGGMRISDEQERVVNVFIPPPFDLDKLLHNEMFPTFAGYMNRLRIGNQLYYDESLRTCPDYDFWIRLAGEFGPSAIVLEPVTIMTARGDRTSMTFRAESYDVFTRDKLAILNRYLDTLPDRAEAARLRATASAGIMCWAAESVLGIEGPSGNFENWCRAAASFDPTYPWLLRLIERTGTLEIDNAGQVVAKTRFQPLIPAEPTVPLNDIVRASQAYCEAEWAGAIVCHMMRVITSPSPWSFSALIPLAENSGCPDGQWRWIRLSVRVVEGQAGFSLLAGDKLIDESFVAAHDGPREIYLRVPAAGARGVIVRNGCLQGASTVEILSVTAEGAAPEPAPEQAGNGPV